LVYFSFACSSGKKALEQGNYDTAVETAIGRLQKSPTNTKAQKVFLFRNMFDKFLWYL
jgi:hypothetical protein